MALTTSQLDLLDKTREVHIRTEGGVETIIWIVVVGNEVYIRSVRGSTGRWYQRALANPEVSILAGDQEIDFTAVHIEDQAVIEAVTEALAAKYPSGGSLDRMTRAEVLDTTLRLDPMS